MTTINKEEIQKFSNLADEWWDVNGKFKPLHMFNPIRIEYILDKISKHFHLDKKKNFFLKDLEILDIGCGGGLISEPMARLGGNVTGIDAAEKNIKIAHLHSKKNNLSIKYLNKSPEQLNEKEKFDVILNLEIVEHVDNLDLYLAPFIIIEDTSLGLKSKISVLIKSDEFTLRKSNHLLSLNHL